MNEDHKVVNKASRDNDSEEVKNVKRNGFPHLNMTSTDLRRQKVYIFNG